MLKCVHEEIYFVMWEIDDLFLDCLLFIVRVEKQLAERRKEIVMIRKSTKQRI